jgi:large subunit ribosomal protein L19
MLTVRQGEHVIMTNNLDIISKLDAETVAAKTAGIPMFDAGDTLKVHVKITEGEKSRVQAFEGICIGRHNKGTGSSFTVRKISYGEGVERVFPLFSPSIEKIEVVRRGDVRRSKIYYLRNLTGKAARIAERARIVVPTTGTAPNKAEKADVVAETPTDNAQA